jgi:putative acetyltransferase
MQIRIDDVTRQDVTDLLRVHLEYCRASSPPESVHALDLDALRAPGIRFWTARDAGNLLGCGALAELDPSHGEIKSMHVAARHRGQGVAAAIVRHIVAEARSRSYRRLSLETG